MRAIERKLRTVLEAKKNERLSRGRISEIIKETNVSLGAQNLFWEKEGPYTGEISPEMLVSAGCRHVILGHSERRQLFGDTDETVNKKVKKF